MSSPDVVTISVDGMGGDFAPKNVVSGCVQAVAETGVNVLLTGPKDQINDELSQHQYPLERIQVIHASEVVTMNDPATAALRKKPNSSMRVAVDLAAKGEADAIVSAGNTGAMYALVKFNVGSLPGIDRLPLAAWFPHPTGRSIVLDVGANVDCKARHLLEFALMGSIYAQEVFNIPTPRVGLLNIGQEDGKGNDLTRETFPLLKNSELNFIGNVEGNDVFKGTADVYVCDGFIGNVALKVSESLVETIFHLLKREIEQQPNVGEILNRYFDYSVYGGAPLLGAKIPSFVCHGKSNSKAIKNAIRVAGEFCSHKVNERIAGKVAHLES